MPKYAVEVEVTQVEVFEVIADDEDDAAENYDDGDQVRMDIEERTVTDVELLEELICTCGHPTDKHQIGEGPWTGFCYGDSDNNCKCERPEVE